MLRAIITSFVCTCLYMTIHAQTKVGDNPLLIDDASILELESSSKGFLISRLTTAERDAQTAWDLGHMIFNKTDSCLQIYDGLSWECFVKGTIIDSTFYKFDGTLTSDRTITLDGNNITFDGSSDVTILSNGRVGIGTPAPNALLEVAGGTVRLSDYGAGSVTSGTPTFILGVDSDGDVIEISSNSVGTDDQTIDSLSFDGTNLVISLEDDAEVPKTVDLSSVNTDNQVIDSFAITGNTLAISIENDGVAPLTVDLSGLDTKLTQEEVEDFAGAMVSGNTETGITVTYDDPAGKLNFVATDASPTNEGLLSVGAGAATTSLIQSNTAGQTPITVTAGSGMSITETAAANGGTITLTNASRLGVGAGAANTSTIVTNVSGQTALTVTAGTGLSIAETISSNGGTITLTNTGDTDASDDITTINAGTGITVSGTGNSRTITNAAPDQTVSLSGAGSVTTSGTYPNFTISGTDTDNQQIDSFALSGNNLIISLEDDGVAPLSVDLSSITGTSDNIYNTNGTLDANRTVGLSSFDLTFDGTSDVIIGSDGNVGIGAAATSQLNVQGDANEDAFYFRQTNTLTAERDVFTIEDQDVGGGSQDESSVLKVWKSGAINSGDDGFSLIELANTGGDPGADKYWISGRNVDEGAPLWGVDLTDNDYWSEGGIILGVTGADGGTYSGGTFRVEADGDVGIGTTTPAARLEVDGGSVRLSDYGGTTYLDSSAQNFLVVQPDGDVREINTVKNTRWFYAPAVTIDASATATGLTIDLHQEYVDQFTNIPAIQRSPGSPASLPIYGETELYYIISYFDPTVLEIVSLSDTGVLTYNIIDVPFDNYTIVNVQFFIK